MTHHYNSITTQKTKQNFIAVTILFMVVFVDHGSHLFFADFYLKKVNSLFHSLAWPAGYRQPFP